MSTETPNQNHDPATRPESSTSPYRLALLWIVLPLALLITFEIWRH